MAEESERTVNGRKEALLCLAGALNPVVDVRAIMVASTAKLEGQSLEFSPARLYAPVAT